MNNSLLGKCGHGFMQQSVRNLCVKFKVDRLSCFCTGARQVFTTPKLFSYEIQEFFNKRRHEKNQKQSPQPITLL